MTLKPPPLSTECVTVKGVTHESDHTFFGRQYGTVQQSGAHRIAAHRGQAASKWSEAENLFLFSLINMGVFGYDTLCINLNRCLKTDRTREGVKKHVERMVSVARQPGHLHTAESFHTRLRALAREYVVESVQSYRMLLFDSTLDKSFFNDYSIEDSTYFMSDEFLYHFLTNFCMDDSFYEGLAIE